MAKGKKTGGRQKGTPNKNTAKVKEAIEAAFEHLEQSTEGFNAWAAQNQTVFYTQLLPKVLPLQVNHADNEGGKLMITWQTGSDGS